MASNPPVGVPNVPQGRVVSIGIPDSQDYPRLVFSAPYFEQVPLAELIEPSVIEAVEAALPSLVPPFVDAAAQAAVQAQAVLLVGSTMSGPLFLSPLMPTADSQAATKAYVDTLLATAGIPEVPPVPQGQIWGRETGQWVPISAQTGVFLPLAGGTMQGNIQMSGNTINGLAAVPALPNGAAPAQWVLNQIAAVSLYQGTWNMDTYTPDLTQLQYRVNGYTWIAITTSVSGVVIGPAIPGLQGQTVFNGDTVIYSTVYGEFQAIHAGGLTQPEAEALFVALTGSQMSGPLLLNANASQNMQAVTFQQLEAAVANTVTPDAPADGQAYLRVGVGASRWVPGLPLAGGILTGSLTLFGNATQNLNPVPLQQMTSAITAATAGFLPLAGGQMTGAMQLSGNESVALNPVPFQQVTAMLTSYAPINNPTFTGTVTIPAGASIAGYAPLASPSFTGTVTIPATAQITTPNIIGVTNGSNAPVGSVGEWLNAESGPQLMPDQTEIAIVGLNLPPGDWEVSGTMQLGPGSGAVMNAVGAGVSSSTSSISNQSGNSQTMLWGSNFSGSTSFIPAPPIRASITVTTAFYIIGYVSYTSGSGSQAFAFIQARRMR